MDFGEWVKAETEKQDGASENARIEIMRSNWKKWPYWLRGGVIGGGVALLFVVLFFSCSLVITPGGFLCLPFILVSPLYPIAMFIDSIPDNHRVLPPLFLTLPILSFLLWFIVGAAIAATIKLVKKDSQATKRKD